MVKEIQSMYMLSPMQKGMLYQYMLNEDSKMYCQQIVMTIDADLDEVVFEQTLEVLIQKYDILRTVFLYEKIKAPAQVVLKSKSGYFKYIDLTKMNDEYIREELDRIQYEDLERRFNISKGPLVRITLIKYDSYQYKIIWSFHHIILDGWSLPMLMDDFIKTYTNLKNGIEIVKDPVMQYGKYIKWLNEQNKNTVLKIWKEYLAGIEQKTVMCPKMKSTTLEYRRCVSKFRLESKSTDKLEEMARLNETTLSVVFNALWGTLLLKYNNSNNVSFGVVSSGREIALPGIEQMVGLAINTIPLCIKYNQYITFIDILMSVKKDMVANIENSFVGLNNILQCSEVEGELFDSIVAFENYPISKIENDSFKIHDISSREQTNYDMTVTVSKGAGLNVTFTYNGARYSHQFVESMQQHLLNIIEQIETDELIKLDDLEILSTSEKKEIYKVLECEEIEYPQNKTIVDIFENQVKCNYDKTALVCESKSITYGELNIQSNRVANTLLKLEVEPENIIGIIFDRSIDMIIAILGILKAEAAYLPIDPNYPKERIKYILDDSKCKVVLLEDQILLQELENSLPSVEVVNMNNLDMDISTQDPNRKIAPNRLAYIIYTSGTTGMPKGVMIEHVNVVRLLFNEKFQFDFNCTDVWTMFHSFCFDFSVWEMFGALLYGGKLIIITSEQAKDSNAFLDILIKEKVTVLNQIPTPFYALMNEEIKRKEKQLFLRYVIFGGEALKPEMLLEWYNRYPNTKLINMYGITETTVHVTYKEITKKEIEDKISNIGKAIPTLRTYIMDKNLKLLPIGIPGELCVAGDGVGRGYLNRKELTNQKFVQCKGIDIGTIYRSGDMARLLENGDIEYLGRIDNQVKIRGYRIEIGEVESSLLDVPTIKEAVVLPKQTKDGNLCLCAYFISDKKLTVTDIRNYLAENLPAYMIPAFFIQIDKMPTTANGKLDRRALLAYESSVSVGAYIKRAETENEKKLVTIWSLVLEIDENKIGVEDNFFFLGGDSIKAISLISMINKKFEIRAQIRDIYTYPTIKDFAAYLQKHVDAGEVVEEYRNEILEIKNRIFNNNFDKLQKITKLEEIEDLYPMSAIERGMIFHAEQQKKYALYHDQLIYPIRDENFSMQLFKEAFDMLTEKHEILRTTFHLDNFEMPIQIVHKKREVDIEYIDIHYIDDVRAQVDFVNDFLRKDREKSFDITEKLWYVKVVRFDNEKLYIVLICHHAILDGWSVASLITELMNVYKVIKFDNEPARLSKLQASYRDFIAEQMMIKNNQEIIDYWKKELEDSKNLNLRNYLMGDSDNKAHKYVIDLGIELTENINRYASINGISVKTICLAAYLCMLNMVSYENDFNVGIIENNRPVCIDGDKILGCFLNTVPFRVKFDRDLTWERLLKIISEKYVEIKKYGRLPLYEIEKALRYQNNTGALIDTVFNYVDFHIYRNVNEKNMIDTEFDKGIEGYAATNTSLDISIDNTENQLLIAFYFTGDTSGIKFVKKLVCYFKNALLSILKNKKARISKSELLTDDEREILLKKFNDTHFSYPEKNLYELFEEVTLKYPNNLAASCGQNSRTYAQLYSDVNNIAANLYLRGIRTGDVVGLYSDNSIEAISTILAVVKLGGIFLPIAPYLPMERIKFILKDSKSRVVVSNLLLDLDTIECKLLSIGDLLRSCDKSMVAYKNTDIQLPAYIVYTSGSTGEPKGVVVSQKSISTTLQWRKRKYSFICQDRVLITISNSFDAFITSVFTPLISGASIFLLLGDVAKDIQMIIKSIIANKVTHYVTVPTMCMPLVNQLAERGSNHLKAITFGGENLTNKMVKECKRVNPGIKIYNEYGPTENSVISTLWDSDMGERVSIGRPKDNTYVYILDENEELQPVGIEGEIVLGGEGIALEYLNRKELTREKFIENPFILGDRMYKSGDLGKWLNCGELDFVGRIDNQVKIRGFRIETDEIEKTLLDHELVEEVAVCEKRNMQDGNFLCAYIVTKKNFNIDILKLYLLEKLPEYMIPSFFIILDKLPRMISGKINKRHLPDPVYTNSVQENMELPGTMMERKVYEIWKEVLGIERIDINKSFFSVGGDSLSANILCIKVQKIVGVYLPLSDVFRFNSIKTLSERILQLSKREEVFIPVSEPKNYYHVTPQQREIYLAQQMDRHSTAYNMPMIMRIEGRLDFNKVKEIVNHMMQHHAILRSSFEIVDGEIIQKISKDIEYNINSRVIEQQDVNEIVKKFVKPFNLKKAPLFRLEVAKITDSSYLLLADIHHIISDGESMKILYDEFVNLYSGNDVYLSNVQYHDYAEWIYKRINSEEIKKQEQYWLANLSDMQPLNLKYDFVPEGRVSFAGNSIRFELPHDLVKQINGFVSIYDVTMYIFFVAAIDVLLFKITGSEDIAFGSTISCRTYEELQNVIGMFVNTIIIRNSMRKEESFLEFLNRIKTNVIKDLDYGAYPYEILAENIGNKNLQKGNALFNVMLTMQQLEKDRLDNQKSKIRTIIPHNKVAKFDLTFSIVSTMDDIYLELEYRTDLFLQSTITNIGTFFIDLLRECITNQAKKIGEIIKSEIPEDNGFIF